MLEVETTG